MKVTFVTYHNWETKRIGGFHKFAEGCALVGHEVVFMSFERPYYIYFKHDERLNKDVLRELLTGKIYKVEKKGKKGSVLNCTWPTIRVPMPLAKLLPECFVEWTAKHSIRPFKCFQNKFLKNTDVFVLESVAVPIFDLLKKHNPGAKFVYRPSDPIMVDGVSEREVEQEAYVLKRCDLNILVNQAGLDLYRRKVKEFDSSVRYEILSNGVDTDKFKERYPIPEMLQKSNTALYVGALAPEWVLTLKMARECTDVNFVIVCPVECPSEIKAMAPQNLHFIPGIYPSEVPAWITNCSVFIVPYPTDMYKIRPWGITAKYYQAMTAKKPIVVYDDTDELRNYGVTVTHTYEDFINGIRSAFNRETVINYNLGDKDWDSINKIFIDKLLLLCQK